MVNIIIITWVAFCWQRLKGDFTNKALYNKASNFQISPWLFLVEWIFHKEYTETVHASAGICSRPETSLQSLIIHHGTSKMGRGRAGLIP